MKTIFYLALVTLFSITTIAQDPGELDTSFSVDGISTQEVPEGASIFDISVFPDGRIISAGTVDMDPDDYDVLSYLFNTNGTLAPFAGDTYLDFQLGYDNDHAKKAFVLPDGRILLAGHFYDILSSSRFFVMCLFEDGSFDTSFGVDGLATDLSMNFYVSGISVLYGLSGEFHVYLCGYTFETHQKPAIIKIDQYGNVVESFGDSGMYILPDQDGEFSDLYVYNLAGSGYLLAGGHDNDGLNIFVSKHDLGTGELIPSFATNGIFSSGISTGYDLNTSCLVFQSSLSNNTVAIFGDYKHWDNDFDIFGFRLHCSNGLIDESFGVNGWSSMRSPDTDESLKDAVLEAETGKYYFGGSSDQLDYADFMIGRITNSGFLDPQFGVNGIVLTNINALDYLSSLALSPDGSRLYASGNSFDGSSHYPSVACYHTGYGVNVSEIDSNAPKILVYPNPAKTQVSILAQSFEIYQLNLYDIAGHLIKSETQSGQKLLLSLQDIVKGLYILEVSDKHDHKTNIKIIKE